MIAIIDYGVGNLFSVEKAFAALGAEARITNNPAEIKAAEKLVLPGVGAFGDCMINLSASGLIPLLKEEVAAGKPMLGICVGLQILFEGSDESPAAAGLGLLKGRVERLDAPELKIPQMGWNRLHIAEPRRQQDLFAGIEQNKEYVYFVHSYHAVPADKTVITAVTNYGGEVTAAVQQGNIMATQFHPEKSGDVGLRIIDNFCKLG
ncbi:MAG: imidazole glycerol phosphate synthase subunit HisH [Selenomonas sp.]|uniref:imidazole glycerol phosphate synthase subunit HisH n=1 Tax=Selenomonas sp. TaxID=2053611 RepID=UPI0025E91F25|nr:imidazole glycerol phosphate synthase subunit HisH [Selenomonas sp.]MCR5757571.1 imidazole glycerol phosphate synthase subunit HisH [Selenomonas sp.]